MKESKGQHPVEGPFFQSAYNFPHKITAIKTGHYLIDFGKTAFGQLHLMSSTVQADSIIIHVGEKLNQQGFIDRQPGGTVRYQRLALPPLAVNTEKNVLFLADNRNSRPPAVLLPDSFGVVQSYLI